jgi:quercetin dioxygenase-like cupin family protein
VSEIHKEAWDPRDGACNERRLMRSIEHEGYEVASYVYAPGTVFPWHEHPVDKCDAVVAGALRIEIAGGQVFDLGPGDRLYLPCGTRHRAEVVGEASVLSLDGTRW